MNNIKQISLFVALLSTVQCTQLDAHIGRTAARNASRFAQTMFRRRNHSSASESTSETARVAQKAKPAGPQHPLAVHTKSRSRWVTFTAMIASGGFGFVIGKHDDDARTAYEKSTKHVRETYTQYKESVRETLHGWVEAVLGSDAPEFEEEDATAVDPAEAQCPLTSNLDAVLAAQKAREAEKAALAKEIAGQDIERKEAERKELRELAASYKASENAEATIAQELEEATVQTEEDAIAQVLEEETGETPEDETVAQELEEATVETNLQQKLDEFEEAALEKARQRALAEQENNN